MGAKENLDLVEQLQQAARDRDFDRYGELVATMPCGAWPVCRLGWVV